jgi:hypothetical protein
VNYKQILHAIASHRAAYEQFYQWANNPPIPPFRLTIDEFHEFKENVMNMDYFHFNVGELKRERDHIMGVPIELVGNVIRRE